MNWGIVFGNGRYLASAWIKNPPHLFLWSPSGEW